jgi:hypothetical protein
VGEHGVVDDLPSDGVNDVKVAQTWPRRWFGLWAESEGGHPSWPSIFDWPRDTLGQREREVLAAALLGAQRVCVSQAPHRTCKLCEHAFASAREWLSDGVWLWPDELAHYVRAHAILLPPVLQARLSDAASSEVVMDTLEWPGPLEGTP